MENIPSLVLFIILIISCVISFTLAVLFCCRLDSRTATNTTTSIRRTTRNSINTINTLTIENILSGDAETVGLEPSVIETFPIIPYLSAKKLKNVKGRHGCAVCLSEFEDHDTLRILPGCCHVFHPTCIFTWLVSHVTCPICRSDLSDPAVLATDTCLLTDMNDMELDNKLIGRSISMAARQSGTSGRWESLIKTLSCRWRKDGESKRIVPTASNSVDVLMEVNMGTSGARENNMV